MVFLFQMISSGDPDSYRNDNEEGERSMLLRCPERQLKARLHALLTRLTVLPIVVYGRPETVA